MLTKAFWALMAVTAALVVLTAMSLTPITVLAVMIVVDILAIEAMRRADMKSINNDLAHVIAARFDSLDKVCGNISGSVNEVLRALGKEPVAEVEEKVAEPVESTQAEEAVIEATDVEKTAPDASFSVNYNQG